MDPRGRSRGQQELVAAPALGRAGGRAASQGACAGARVGATPPAHPRTRSPHHPWHCRLHGAAWGQNGPLLSTWGCALSIFLSACSLLCLARLLATLSPPCHSSAGRGLLPWDLLQLPAAAAQGQCHQHGASRVRPSVPAVGPGCVWGASRVRHLAPHSL